MEARAEAAAELHKALEMLEWWHHDGTQDDIMDAAFKVNNSWRNYKEAMGSTDD